MTVHADIYNMNDRELKVYKKALRLRIERRRKMFVSFTLLSLTVCAIVFCALSHQSIKSNANSDFKYYTSVTVEAGETLWDLSDEFIDYEHYSDKNSYIEEVQSINHLDADCAIVAGQMLIVPYYSNEYK